MPGGALFGKLAEMAAAKPELALKAAKYGVGAVVVGVPATALAVPIYWRTLKGVWGGKSFAGATLDAVLDEDFSRKGVLGTTKKIVAGGEAADMSTGQIVVDELGGKGTFDATRDVVGNTVDGAGNVLAYAGGLVKGGVDSTREMASTIQEGLTAMVDQHFGPGGSQQLPQSQVQAQQAALYQAAMQQGYFPQTYPQGVQMGTGQGGSVLGGVGSTLSNLVNGFTGGGSNNLALAGLLAGAYMLFGGFGGGILSKVIGGVMGGYAFRSLAKGNSQPQQVMAPAVSPGQFQSRLQDNYEQQMQQYEHQQQKDNGTTILRTV